MDTDRTYDTAADKAWRDFKAKIKHLDDEESRRIGAGESRGRVIAALRPARDRALRDYEATMITLKAELDRRQADRKKN